MASKDPGREWIDHYFVGETGRFLDIGAYDGVTSSLTAGLAEAGWRGVFVEPTPRQFSQLIERYHDNPRLEFVHAAIAERAGLAKFWIADRGQASTIDEGWRKRFIQLCGTIYSEVYVATVTPRELLDAFGGPRDWRFVSIDAEGVSIELCCSLPLAEMVDTEIICIEWDTKGLTEDSLGQAELMLVLAPYYNVVSADVTNVIVKRIDGI